MGMKYKNRFATVVACGLLIFGLSIGLGLSANAEDDDLLHPGDNKIFKLTLKDLNFLKTYTLVGYGKTDEQAQQKALEDAICIQHSNFECSSDSCPGNQISKPYCMGSTINVRAINPKTVSSPINDEEVIFSADGLELVNIEEGSPSIARGCFSCSEP